MSETTIKLAKLLQISDKTIANTEKLKTTLNARIVGLGLGVVCGRCGGTGNYSSNQIDGTMCYGCTGKGYKMPKVTNDLIVKTEKAIEEGKLVEYLKLLEKAKQKPSHAIAKCGFASMNNGKVITKGNKYKVSDYYKNKKNSFTIWIKNDHNLEQSFDAKDFELIYE